MLSPFSGRGNGITEKLNNLSENAQLVSGSIGIQNPGSLNPESMFSIIMFF